MSLLDFASSASYRIRVEGFLDDSWSDKLIGMTIDNQGAGCSTPIATLSVKVGDQEELLGLLNSLCEMHLPLVSIEILDS